MAVHQGYVRPPPEPRVAVPETPQSATVRPSARTAGRPDSAFEALLAGAAESAYCMALCLADGEATAVELLHQAVAGACQDLKGIAPDADIRLWFLGILTREHLAAVRRESEPADETDLDDTPDLHLYARSAALGWPTTGEHPAAELLERLGTERVVKALRRLPADYRVLCTLYFMADLSYEEIARVMAYPVGTVRARLHRARKMLQKSLWQIAEAEGMADRPGGTA
jgi:RNA polymerase sigma-70 factor (ECF subfamily)